MAGTVGKGLSRDRRERLAPAPLWGQVASLPPWAREAAPDLGSAPSEAIGAGARDRAGAGRGRGDGGGGLGRLEPARQGGKGEQESPAPWITAGAQALAPASIA